ncbi:MAG: DNA/RNA non-specific endonuclease [Limosilactobacillus pontis]
MLPDWRDRPADWSVHAGALGDQDNPRNLFTETDFTNEVLQTYYEAQVRHAIERGKHVIYQATPIFRGDEMMARESIFRPFQLMEH